MYTINSPRVLVCAGAVAFIGHYQRSAFKFLDNIYLQYKAKIFLMKINSLLIKHLTSFVQYVIMCSTKGKGLVKVKKGNKS